MRIMRAQFMRVMRVQVMRVIRVYLLRASPRLFLNPLLVSRQLLREYKTVRTIYKTVRTMYKTVRTRIWSRL
jgi:hypothetical protein